VVMKNYLRFETMRKAALTVASVALALGLFYATGTVTYAGPVANDLMLVNARTGKCLTIAGGVSTDNNVDAVQFDCDSDPSRRWTLNQMSGGSIYQIKNVKTGKCLTIAGGVSTDNNVTALQFDCDSDPSRTWRISDVTGSGVYQIRNVQTGKCLTIAGGVSTDNNVRALQFSCDTDPSRRWTIRLKL
jgi:cytolethal distending toxin subunit A